MIFILICLAVVADLTDREGHALAFLAMAVFLMGADRVAKALAQSRR